MARKILFNTRQNNAMTVPKAMSPNASPKTSMKPMAALCYRGLCTLWVRGPACLPLVALAPWGLPRSRSSARSRGTPAARGAASAAPRASFGSDSSSAGARRSVWRATRRWQLLRLGFCRVRLRRVLLCFGTRRMSLDLFAQCSAPRCGNSFALAHSESCRALRRVAVEVKA